MINLSICIPTYNRAFYLDEALRSIIKEMNDNELILRSTEICISDNASTDNTEDIISEWKNKTNVKINYKKNPENLGADTNYLKVIEMATGRYCWFMGSDDILKPKSLEVLFKYLESNCEVYLLNRSECDINMNFKQERYWLNKSQKSRIYDFKYNTELTQYLKQSQSLGALFSYLSSIVFIRLEWNEQIVNDLMIGTAYVHVDILFKILLKKNRLHYIKDTLVNCRGGNDSFLNGSVVNRIMLDFVGYKKVFDTFLSDKKNKKLALNIMRRERTSLRTLAILRLNMPDEDWKRVSIVLLSFEYNKILIYIIGYLRKIIFIYKKYIR
jgi:abequosyltransferase